MFFLCSLSCNGSGYTRYLHSFPTRRSSDLTARSSPFSWRSRVARRRRPTDHDRGAVAALAALAAAPRGARRAPPRPDEAARSEEHTSELQSHSDLVCRLLLEKKK